MAICIFFVDILFCIFLIYICCNNSSRILPQIHRGKKYTYVNKNIKIRRQVLKIEELFLSPVFLSLYRINVIIIVIFTFFFYFLTHCFFFSHVKQNNDSYCLNVGSMYLSCICIICQMFNVYIHINTQVHIH